MTLGNLGPSLPAPLRAQGRPPHQGPAGLGLRRRRAGNFRIGSQEQYLVYRSERPLRKRQENSSPEWFGWKACLRLRASCARQAHAGSAARHGRLATGPTRPVGWSVGAEATRSPRWWGWGSTTRPRAPSEDPHPTRAGRGSQFGTGNPRDREPAGSALPHALEAPTTVTFRQQLPLPMNRLGNKRQSSKPPNGSPFPSGLSFLLGLGEELLAHHPTVLKVSH